MRLLVTVCLFTVVVAILILSVGCGSSRYELKEPIDVDFDMEDIPEPKEERVSQYYDFIDRTFFKETARGFDIPRHFRALGGNPKQADNFDGFGNVPNSSWFTNRNGKKPMSIEEIKRGPNKTGGPAEGTWTVVRGKTQGVTPGFTIEDSRGDRYIIKFDPAQNPEMSTAAEVISTKLFYAIGHNTPENTLVLFSPDRLEVDPEAKFVDRLGNKRRMTQRDLNTILGRVAKNRDGTFRAVASKYLDGVPKGPYSYHGTRTDDPNDIIRHEHRRDLRGLKVFASWLQHNDVRRINSLDMYVTEDGRSFIKHYLIDFGATLGSASLFPNLPLEGHEYQFDVNESLKSLFTLGVYKRRWLDAKETEYPSVGYIEAELFDPPNWKPNYPIPAFQNMTNLDAYWAAKIVMSFTDDQIRAAVETGELRDPMAEEYLTRILIERRDKIGRYWFGQVNALDQFSIEGTPGERRLEFDDLEVTAGFVDPSQTSYRCELIHDGCDGRDIVVEGRVFTTADVVESGGIPLEPELLSVAGSRVTRTGSGNDCDRLFYLTLWTNREATGDDWGKWVRVHLRFVDAGQGFEITGVRHQN